MKNIKNRATFVPDFKERKGTTLVELLVVILIIGVISFFGLLSLFSRKGKTDLDNTVIQITSLLGEARSRSAAQASSTSWGVHFDNTGAPPFFATFYSGAYSTSTRTGYYKLPTSLVYATSTVPSGSSVDITFNQISGLASASTSITLLLTGPGPTSSSTIHVASSGAAVTL